MEPIKIKESGFPTSEILPLPSFEELKNRGTRNNESVSENTPVLAAPSNILYNRAGQSFLDASLSEEQLLAIIDRQASMGNNDPDKSLDEILRMIDENNSFTSNKPIEPNVCTITFPPIAQHPQNSYISNFTNIPTSTPYLSPYFQMNLYHHQMLMGQGSQQRAQQPAYFSTTSTSRNQLDYNQNLDNYIETVFEDQQDQSTTNSVHMNYNLNSIVDPKKKVISPESEMQPENQISHKDLLEAPVQLQHESVHTNKQVIRTAPISQCQTAPCGAFKSYQHSLNNNQYFHRNVPQKMGKQINAPLPISIRGGFRHHPPLKPSGLIKKIGVMSSFPQNTKIIPYEQSNVYLISNQANSTSKRNCNNFQYMIPPPEIAVRPPLRTKRSIITTEFLRGRSDSNEKSQKLTYIDTKDDCFSKIDFSSLDTSDIVIAKNVTPQLPVHKNRKQKIVVLTDSEMTFKLENFNKSSTEFSIENKLVTTIQNESALELVQEKEIDEIPLSKLKTFKNEESSKSKNNRKNLKKLIQKHHNTGYDPYTDDEDDDLYHEDSFIDKINLKSLKCLKCMKIFKSAQTLAKHRKQHPIDEKNSVYDKTSNHSVNDAKVPIEKSLKNDLKINSEAFPDFKNQLFKATETADKKSKNIVIENSEVENSLAELFAEKSCKIDEDIFSFNNSINNNNDNDYDYDYENMKPEDKVEESLAVLFSDGPSKREFEKVNIIEMNDINKKKELQLVALKNDSEDNQSNKRIKQAIPFHKEINFKNDNNCDDLLEALTPKQKIKIGKKTNQLSKALKVELNKETIAQNPENSLIEKKNSKITKKITILKPKTECNTEENNQKRKTRSQTKRKNETEISTNDKRKK